MYVTALSQPVPISDSLGYINRLLTLLAQSVYDDMTTLCKMVCADDLGRELKSIHSRVRDDDTDQQATAGAQEEEEEEEE